MVRRATRILPFVLAICVAAGGADAQSSLLHEFIPPDAKDDLAFAATTSDGDLPAAIQTPSGPVPAPDSRKPPPTDHVYSSSTVDDGPESTYEPDRDTRKPNIERYDDPFSPATAPYKRLRAYDSVGADYTLRVRSRGLKPVPVGGTLQAGEETFYGDLSVDLLPEEPVRIPTVGPDARVLRVHVEPEAQVEISRDGADNWFVRGKVRQRVRLIEQLAIARSVFGSPFGDPEWSELAPHVEPPPVVHLAAFEEVARAIGISRAMRPRDVVAKMVEYHRSFEPSDDPPRGRGDIYLDLAISKKGVCRHRSFVFLVTALYIGVPARMVVNEAHAWVEVFDGQLWHRVDLGGAAANLESNRDAQRPPHSPPADPYAWPPNSQNDSGQAAVDRARQQGPGPNASASASASAGPNGSAPPNSPNGPQMSTDPTRPSTDVIIGDVEGRVLRGAPMRVLGEIKTGGSGCAHVRVDVLLVSADAPQGAAVGSLSTDETGHFDGPVVVPSDFRLGTYELLVQTPGDAQCAPGESKR
ncbi:MAG: transglutaminase family protein [Polyangiaceae bacterium]|nr:transglutaminase family protein [Polyangiaceae bacterium]